METRLAQPVDPCAPVKARLHFCVAELSVGCYAVTTKLQRSNALICFTEHTLKRIENETLLRYATLKCERALRGHPFAKN